MSGHMVVWLVWVQSDDATWIDEAWDDDATAENRQGYEEAVARVRKLAHDNGYEMRIQRVLVPGVHDLFIIPTAATIDGGEANDA